MGCPETTHSRSWTWCRSPSGRVDTRCNSACVAPSAPLGAPKRSLTYVGRRSSLAHRFGSERLASGASLFHAGGVSLPRTLLHRDGAGRLVVTIAAASAAGRVQPGLQHRTHLRRVGGSASRVGGGASGPRRLLSSSSRRASARRRSVSARRRAVSPGGDPALHHDGVRRGHAQGSRREFRPQHLGGVCLAEAVGAAGRTPGAHHRYTPLHDWIQPRGPRQAPAGGAHDGVGGGGGGGGGRGRRQAQAAAGRRQQGAGGGM